MSFDSDKGLAGNSIFRIKVEMAMIKAAGQIAGETPASPANIPKDDKRHDLTQNVYSNKEAWLDRFAHACAAKGTLSNASTDADVEFTVGEVWDDLAGVTGAEA